MKRSLIAVVAMLAAAACSQAAVAQVTELACGALTNHYGPFDYRPEKFRPIDNRPYFDMLNVVERAHFTPEIETLVRGRSAPIGGELDYTLRAFPNHHRALLAVMRFGEKMKSAQPDTLPRPVECYFDRAVRFSRDDNTVRLLYATFLLHGKRTQEAISHIGAARANAGDNGFTHYNVGLLYLDAGYYELALTQAHRAMALDFPRMELKNRLVALGKWQDPPAETEK